MTGWHRHRHRPGPTLQVDTTNEGWGLLTGHQRGPKPGHQRGLSHGHGHAWACSRVRALEGRPDWPVGVPHSSTTLRRTLSLLWARVIARRRMDLRSATVRVLSDAAFSTSHWSTSSAERSTSLRAPSEGMTCWVVSQRGADIGELSAQFVDRQLRDSVLDVARPFTAGGGDAFPALDRSRNCTGVAGPFGARVELAAAPPAVASRAPADHRGCPASRGTLMTIP